MNGGAQDLGDDPTPALPAIDPAPHVDTPAADPVHPRQAANAVSTTSNQGKPVVDAPRLDVVAFSTISSRTLVTRVRELGIRVRSAMATTERPEPTSCLAVRAGAPFKVSFSDGTIDNVAEYDFILVEDDPLIGIMNTTEYTTTFVAGDAVADDYIHLRTHTGRDPGSDERPPAAKAE